MNKYLYQDLNDQEQLHWWHISKRKTIISLMRQSLTERNPTILDIGCGTGKNVEEFTRLGRSYGLDISKEAIKFCQNRGLKNVSLGRSENLPYSNSKFSAVTLLDVLEHINEKPSLREVRRVLKKNGYLFITVPSYQFLWSRWDEVLHHKRRYTQKKLRKALEQNGFKILKISYLYSFLVPPVLIIRFFKSKFSQDEYCSDFKITNSLINKILLFLADQERRFLYKKSLLFGTSIVCVARKENPLEKI
jgi:ubiquinone/menaquinone biosynthesis C-methylase UbiE